MTQSLMTRNTNTIAAIVFVLLSLALVMVVPFSATLLPERVATHFNFHGVPDGWMSRSGYVRFTIAFGLGMPLLIIALCYVARYMPDAVVNFPNKSYWLTPGRRERAYGFLFAHSFWMGSLMLVFFGAMHFLMIHANRSDPVRLPNEWFFTVLLTFLALLGVWLFQLFRHFSKPQE